MKNKLFILILWSLVYFSEQMIFAQEKVDSIQLQENVWASRRPQTLKAGRKVVPLFGAKKIGAAKNMEWRIQPLFFLISPNLGLKKCWKENNRWSIASFHQINYPSFYLNLIAREGSGGVLPKDSEIPPMLSLRNEILLGFSSKKMSSVTFRVGVATAFKIGSGEKNFPDIDFPFLYNRTLAFNHTPTFYGGINFYQDILPRLNMELDITAFQVNNENGSFIFENQLIFFWRKSSKFGLKAGVAAAYGSYPYGFDWRMIPVFDVIFGLNKKRH